MRELIRAKNNPVHAADRLPSQAKRVIVRTGGFRAHATSSVMPRASASIAMLPSNEPPNNPASRPQFPELSGRMRKWRLQGRNPPIPIANRCGVHPSSSALKFQS